MSPAELARLYDAHAPALFAHLLGLLTDEADVRDVLQEVFHKLAIQPGLLRDVRDERAYLLRLAHHAGIDLCRSQARRRQRDERAADDRSSHTTELFSPATDPDEVAFRNKLTEALSELPIDQRAVVQLKLWENFTFERIAETLGIPLNTAASRYRYGIDKLRTRLRPFYDEIR